MNHNDPIIAAIVGKLDAEIAAKECYLGNNSCGSIEDYRHTTGFLRGLRASKNIIDDVMRRMVEDDDEDFQ